ncbi:hypothetical protein CQ018_04515 [Arthrobacter sp. MYb227]|nr:hypothetical protein CQ018_04515 [Arthrobacter sp. MYb227]
MLARRVITLGVAALVLSGCTSLTDPDGQQVLSSPTTNNAGAPGFTDPSLLRVPGLSWASGEGLPEYQIHRVTLDQAREAVRDRDYTEVSTTEKLVTTGTLLIPFGLDETGTLAGFTGQQSDHPIDAVLFSGATGVGRYTDGKLARFTEHGKNFLPPETAIGLGSVGPEGTVWSEPDEDWQSGRWRILWVPHGQSEVRVLASSADVQDPTQQPPTYYGASTPVFSNGRVFWHASFHAEDSALIVPKLLSVAFDEPGHVRIEDAEGFDPVPVGSEILYVGTQRPAPGSEPAALGAPVPAQIAVLDASGTARSLVELSPEAPPANQIMNLGAQQGIVSFTYLGDFYIANTLTGKVIALPMPSGTGVANVVHCDQRVSFRFSDGGHAAASARYVYDVASESLLVVQDPNFTGGAQCAGDLISWSVAKQLDGHSRQWDVMTRWKR